jgi:iron complex transport system ATP-binding protein
VTPGQVAVRLDGVTVSRGSRAVLHDIDLAVAAGEVVAVVGPNGSGKSSLVSAVAGDLSDIHGSIQIDGEAISSWTPLEAAMRRAVLTQQSSVAFPFTVGSVVAMGRAPWAGTDRELDDVEAIDTAIDAMEVRHLAGRPFTTLSGGERARVALARVLAQTTAVLMLDEPTAALDIRHQELVLHVARQRAAQGVAVLVVLHDLAVAAAHADRIVVLDAGRIVADAPPTEVLEPGLLGRVYDWPIEVIRHPVDGALLVQPDRRTEPRHPKAPGPP